MGPILNPVVYCGTPQGSILNPVVYCGTPQGSILGPFIGGFIIGPTLLFLQVIIRRPKALVMVSLDEYRRPLEKVSPTQSATLAATGLIWTRYCLVIKPINYALSLCNFCLGIANSVQCFRAVNFQMNIKEKEPEEIVEATAVEATA